MNTLVRRVALSALLSVTLLIIVSMIPTFLGIERDERIIIIAAGFRSSIRAFADYLRAGNLNRFMMGATPRLITEESLRFGMNSALLIFPAALLATLYSFSMPLARRVIASRAPQIVSWLALLPVFMLATLLQSLALGVNRLVGQRLFTLAYLGGVGTPVLLPALTMLLPIAAFSLRAAEASAGELARTEYVRAAVGRSVPGWSIWFRHVGSGLLRHLEDLLPRTAATAIATLFITERVFNIPGMTVMLTQYPYHRYMHVYPDRLVELTRPDGTVEIVSMFGGNVRTTGVQFQVVIAAALALAALYILTVLACRLLISALRRALQ